ncbi:MAG: hypothetical protein L3J71_03500 [Victivallaceae bacterium]|nr:hypothetical protein [Victivallaceae bacterium]
MIVMGKRFRELTVTDTALLLFFLVPELFFLLIQGLFIYLLFRVIVWFV